MGDTHKEARKEGKTRQEASLLENTWWDFFRIKSTMQRDRSLFILSIIYIKINAHLKSPVHRWTRKLHESLRNREGKRMLDTRDQELQPVQREGSNNGLTLTWAGASARSKEQHEATSEWNLLSGVQLRKETADRTERGSVTVKGPTLLSHWCYKYSFGLTGFQQ